MGEASTIAAIATPRGAGGIGIVRISGPEAKAFLSQVFLPFSEHFENFSPWQMHRGKVLDSHGEPFDDVLAVFMPGPRTYTGEDMAEIHCHGGPFIVQSVLEGLLRLGARQAERGEFTRRAFVNGRMDLSQAEAVAELVAAPSREAVRYSLNRLDGLLAKKVLALRDELDSMRLRVSLAVDFPDEETPEFGTQEFALAVQSIQESMRQLLAGKKRARIMQEGACVVLAGAVNAGKSSLLNALLGRERALVTHIPGTTRDFLEESCELAGLPAVLVDTAGLRRLDAAQGETGVEAMGIALSREKLGAADCVLLVVDGGVLGEAGAASPTCPDEAGRQVLESVGETPLIVVWNKSDLCFPGHFPPAWAEGRPCCSVCARSGENVDALARTVADLLLDEADGAPPVDGLAPNARQALALEGALEELQALLADILAGVTYDCLAVRLDTVAARLGEVTGISSPDEVLDRIFSGFCIGK